MDSILHSIKRMLPGTDNDPNFDLEIMAAVNSAFYSLKQLGVGPEEGFTVTGPDETWSDFCPDETRLSCLKTYILLKTIYLFDPPDRSYILHARESQIKELEWRIKEQEGWR